MFIDSNEIYSTLEKLGIKFDVVKHLPATTIELADKYIEGYEGVRTKTLFLTDNKKRRFFLFVLDEKKDLDLIKFSELLGVKRLKFASENTISQKLDLTIGVVSPFGLLNNEDRDVEFFIDTDIKDMVLTFHPNSCESTIFIDYSDLIRFLESNNCKVNELQF